MATNENLIPIPGRLHSVATEGHVAGADEIYDDNKGKLQSVINSDVDTELGNKIPTSQKGAAGGVASLDNSGKVPSSQLPSYVDDVIEGYYYDGSFYKEAAHTTVITGEEDKIYIDIPTSKSYRWSGSAYIPISNPYSVDEEDLTVVNNNIKFKDRPNIDGMGRVILRKNMVSGVNTLTQSMINQQNTIYVIQYDFTLGEDITVPANCVLEFNGGSISGAYTLTGTNTGINAGLVKIFNTDITLSGTWNVAEAYPEWFGAKGDGITNDYDAFVKVLNLSSNIYLTHNYKLGSELTINKDILLSGSDATLSYGPIKVTNHKCVIRGISFKDIETNAINATNSDLDIQNCSFSNVGTYPNLNITYQGCGIYITDGSLVFKNNYVYRTHGHGGIFVIGGVNVNIESNTFLECDYRAIAFYNAGNSFGVISNNYIKDNGKNLSGNSGVGCNGIYANSLVYDLVIRNNTILNVIENGIEVTCKEISGNSINGTGVDSTKATSSTEGIYVMPTGQKITISNNITRNTKGGGIRCSMADEISNLVITNNTFLDDRDGYAIYLNSFTQKKINDCVISGNRGNGIIITLSNSNTIQTNIIKDNDIKVDIATLKYMVKNIFDYAKDLQITTFDSENLGTFTLKNGTVSYQDAQQGKKAVFAVNQYFGLYKTVDRLPNDMAHGISIRFKGIVKFTLYNMDNSYYSNSGTAVSTDEFSTFNYVYDISSQKKIMLESISGSTLEVLDIREFVVTL